MYPFPICGLVWVSWLSISCSTRPKPKLSVQLQFGWEWENSPVIDEQTTSFVVCVCVAYNLWVPLWSESSPAGSWTWYLYMNETQVQYLSGEEITTLEANDCLTYCRTEKSFKSRSGSFFKLLLWRSCHWARGEVRSWWTTTSLSRKFIAGCSTKKW